MISRYEAILNDVALSSISSDILILDINYEEPQKKIATYNVANRDGARIHKEYTSKVSVKISFEIHSYDTATRQNICSSINRWAKNGGILKTSDRTGQRLRCVCTGKPSIISAMKWTEALSITFTAYALPYWEEDVQITKALTAGTSGSATLYVPGNEDGAFFEVDILANASLSSVSLTANGKTLTLSNLSVSSGSTIKITYSDDMIQSIKVGTTSLLGKRSGADDLLAKCGEYNSLSFTASASVTVTFKVRGLWS